VNSKPEIRFYSRMYFINFNFLAKLKDLIAMPEEYDKEESIEHSHISDQDLFNLTSSVMRRSINIFLEFVNFVFFLNLVFL